MWSTGRPSSASWGSSAQPAATVSRQPVSPQRQGRPAAASTLVCPISPAAPRWPETTRPSAMMPSPSPVEALTTIRSSYVAAWPSRSDRASTSASLPTKIGAAAE